VWRAATVLKKKTGRRGGNRDDGGIKREGAQEGTSQKVWQRALPPTTPLRKTGRGGGDQSTVAMDPSSPRRPRPTHENQEWDFLPENPRALKTAELPNRAWRGRETINRKDGG